MNILVTGSKGQLGSELQAISNQLNSATFFFTDVQELNITEELAILNYCKEKSINCIINCAAYTAVDNAEDDIETATLINATAVSYLAKAAKACNAKMIHVSTDYVFDGTAHEPYLESHPTAPQSVYGHTKLKGETNLLEILPEAIIIRTSWLYSSFGNNFVKTIKRLGEERDLLTVIFDQVGTPTYAGDLANVIIEIVKQDCKAGGIFHFSNEGVCSWYDFAISILKKNGITCKVKPVESTEFKTKAVRPKYSVLNKRNIKESYSVEIPHWEDALDRCLVALNTNNE